MIRNGQERLFIGAWVYSEMILQICLEYKSLPDVRQLTLSEIEFFYEGLKPSLKEFTKPHKK